MYITLQLLGFEIMQVNSNKLARIAQHQSIYPTIQIEDHKETQTFETGDSGTQRRPTFGFQASKLRFYHELVSRLLFRFFTRAARSANVQVSWLFRPGTFMTGADTPFTTNSRRPVMDCSQPRHFPTHRLPRLCHQFQIPIGAFKTYFSDEHSLTLSCRLNIDACIETNWGRNRVRCFGNFSKR